jgi:hypothetical protein
MPLLWRCLARERKFKEAEHVARRWEEDVSAFEHHLNWIVLKGGRYRMRDTHVRAARTLRSWEDAERLLVAEEAIDDPLRMIPFFLTGEAIAGKVVKVDIEHREWSGHRKIARPRITIETAEPCTTPLETELFWTEAAAGREYTVIEIKPVRRRASLVTLQLETSAATALPTLGRHAVFSIHSLDQPYFLRFPESTPWTHAQPMNSGGVIEEPVDARGWE